MTIRRADETDEELAGRFVRELDDNFLYCRALRRHRYPVLLPPKPGRTIRVPRGLSYEPVPGQPALVMEIKVCEICGRVCRAVTDRNAILTGMTRRTYEDPAGYAAPRGTGKYLQGKVAAYELERRLDEGGLFGMPED